MNFNEYPLKVELSDGLHVYERETGKSAHMLVEQLINKYLIEHGYLNVAIENLVKYPEKLLSIDEDIMLDEESEETDSFDKGHDFSTKKQGKGVRLFCEDLDFSSHAPEHIEKIISELNKLNFGELESLSVNNFNKSIHQYKPFLYSTLGLSDFLPKPDKNVNIFHDKRYDTFRVMKNGIHFGSHLTIEKARWVRDFMASKNWDKKYSSKEKKLKGKPYTQWLYSEIEKEEQLKETD